MTKTVEAAISKERKSFYFFQFRTFRKQICFADFACFKMIISSIPEYYSCFKCRIINISACSLLFQESRMRVNFKIFLLVAIGLVFYGTFLLWARCGTDFRNNSNGNNNFFSAVNQASDDSQICQICSEIL